MPAVSALFLALALVLAVVIGPQTRPWTWGPALLALSGSLATAMPVIFRRGRFHADFGFIALAAITVVWFAARAILSPVAEFGQADLLLLCAAVAAFICVRVVCGNLLAERILTWSIAMLLLANLIVIGIQIFDPSFTPVFRSKATEKMVSGFFAHYNEAANFLIAASMLVAAAAVFGNHRRSSRLILGFLSIGGLAAIWFTHSRGGIMAGGVAGFVFFVLAMISGRRRNAKWFVPAVIGVPLIGIGLTAFVLQGWMAAQEVRLQGSGLSSLMDNNARLYFLGIALSTIGTHPATGGGARSFSWECFRFVDAKTNGDIITHKPELVHNELAQAATDYGWIGAGLLGLLLAAFVFAVVLRSIFEKQPAEADQREAWRIGALAALSGMFIQSCFSFVFHLLPGVLLLGMSLGMMSRPGNSETGAKAVGNRIIFGLAAVAGLVLLAFSGWNGARVTRILWPTYFAKIPLRSPEARMDALTQAIAIWPQSSFYQDRALLHADMAKDSSANGTSALLEAAVADYQNAAERNPFDPSYVVNEAGLLSELARDVEAEKQYARAIQLQGGMEPCFRCHFSLADHYLRKSIRNFDPNQPGPSLDALELAADQVETAVRKMHRVTPDFHVPRVAIHQNLGIAREGAGDREGALQAYDFTTTLHNGHSANYLAGLLIGKQAVEAWFKRRPSEALTLFLQAKQRILKAGDALPPGVTISQRAEFLAYLDDSIQYLKVAKVEPLK